MADRITELLARRAEPASTSELPQAIGSAILKKTTFGDALNNLRAQNLAQKRMEQTMSLEERSMALAEKEFDFKNKKFIQDYQNADATAFEGAFANWSDGLSKQDQAQLYLYAKDHKDSVTAQNANTILAEATQSLGLKRPGKDGAPKVVSYNSGDMTITERYDADGRFLGKTTSPRWKDEASGKRKATNLLLPGGERASGYEENGQLFVLKSTEGEGPTYAPAPPGTSKAAVTQEAGEPQDIVLQRKYTEQRTAMKNLVDMAKASFELLSSPTFVGGIGGATARRLNSMRAQGESLAKAYHAITGHEDSAGNDLSWQKVLNADYDMGALQDVAASNVRAKSAVVSIAYMVARTQDPDGRLSDRDVQNALDQLGSNSNDPDIIIQTINDAVLRAWMNFENFSEEMGVTPDTQEFGIDSLVIPEEPERPQVTRYRYDAEGRLVK